MRLYIDHSFQRTTIERFVEVYFSDAFNDEIGPEIGVCERCRLEHEQLPDGRVRTRTKVVPAMRLPAAIRRMIGAVPIVYHEVSVYDPVAHVIEYRVEHVAEKHLQVHGTIRFTALDDGVRRVLEGEVCVRVLAVRRLVERVIEAELQKAYARKSELMQAYLDRHAPA